MTPPRKTSRSPRAGRDSAHAAQWASRPWNQEAGRVAWWIARAQTRGTHVAQQAARLFWLELLAQHGDLEARRLLAGQGVKLPAWLASERAAVRGTGSNVPVPAASARRRRAA